MTNPNQPRVRERYRRGLRLLNSEIPPQSGEALFDKTYVELEGSIRMQSEEALVELASAIGGRGPLHGPRLFGAGRWQGRRYSTPCVSDLTVTGKGLQVMARGAEASIKLSLALNPIRTLSHLLDRYEFSEIEDLDPTEFFRSSLRPTAKDHTLDGRDNMLVDYAAFATTVHIEGVQRVARYLAVFETQLQRLILQHICPVEQGYRYEDDHGDLIARSDDGEVRLAWQRLAVTQCEVCWERQNADALAVVDALANGALVAARSSEVATHFNFTGAVIARNRAALSVRLPLTEKGKVQLVIYAKGVDRVRFEVRYLSDIPQDVRNDRSRGGNALACWLRALAVDAADRVAWPSLHQILTPRIAPELDALIDLTDAVADATKSAPHKRRELLRHLLTYGAVTATNRDGFAPAMILTALARAGVVEHIRLIARDAHIGRRYRLAPRYAGLARLE